MRKSIFILAFTASLVGLSLLISTPNPGPQGGGLHLGQLGSSEDNISGICDRLIPPDEVERGGPFPILHLSRHSTRSACSDYYTVYFYPLGTMLDIATFAIISYGTAWLFLRTRSRRKRSS